MDEEKNEIIPVEEANQELTDEDMDYRYRNLITGIGVISLGATLVVGGIGFTVVKNYNRPKNSFHYVTDHDGKIHASGRVKYKEVMNHWYLLEKQLNNGKSKLFIVDGKSKLFIVDRDFSREFVDIETNKPVASCTVDLNSSSTMDYIDPTILNVEKLGPYLLSYDMVYDSYTCQDIEKLLGLIAADYEYSYETDSKDLMKEYN